MIDWFVKLNRDLNKFVCCIDVIINIVIRVKCVFYKVRYGDFLLMFNVDDW